MIGHIAAAIDLVDFDSLRVQDIVRREDVFAMRVTAKSEDWRVFQKNEGVGYLTGFALGYELPLYAQSFCIAGATEVEEVDDHVELECMKKDAACGGVLLVWMDYAFSDIP
jgi:hypothetical protein